LFEELARRGKTVVMVTHDPSLTSRTTRNIIIADGELIDETIARALPWLRHRHMMEFTRLVEERAYAPGETIIPYNTPVTNLFMIRKGKVEVVLPQGKNNHVVLSHLQPGQFFGEMELMRGGKSLASVRAGQQEPVEILTIKRDDFLRVIEESPITADALGKVIQQRMEAYRAADGRNPIRKLFRKF
jgi:CRP-like cAMP-binding protein